MQYTYTAVAAPFTSILWFHYPHSSATARIQVFISTQTSTYPILILTHWPVSSWEQMCDFEPHFITEKMNQEFAQKWKCVHHMVDVRSSRSTSSDMLHLLRGIYYIYMLTEKRPICDVDRTIFLLSVYMFTIRGWSSDFTRFVTAHLSWKHTVISSTHNLFCSGPWRPVVGNDTVNASMSRAQQVLVMHPLQ